MGRRQWMGQAGQCAARINNRTGLPLNFSWGCTSGTVQSNAPASALHARRREAAAAAPAVPAYQPQLRAREVGVV